MEENKKNKKGYIVLIVVLILLLPACFFAGVKYNEMTISNKDTTKKQSKNKKNTKKETSATKEQDKTSIENVDINSLTVSSDKIINPEGKGWTYTEVSSSADSMGLDANVNKKDNTGSIEIHWEKFHKYSVGYLRDNAQGGTYGDNVQTITVNGFKGKVHSAFISGFGQTFGTETAFYIMDDGTVEFVPIQKLYDDYGAIDNVTLNSYGVIPNVSGVAKIVQAEASAPQSAGSMTTLGIKADGSFYDFQFNLDLKSLNP